MIHPVDIAQAPAPAPPAIVLETCGLARPDRHLDYREAAVRITFVNRGPVPVTDVTIDVRYYYAIKTVQLHGLFSPGVTIAHVFPNVVTGEPYSPQAFACDVRAVTTNDGKTVRYNPPQPYPVETGFPAQG